MKDFFFIFFTISVVVALIYFVYKLMFGVNQKQQEEELQISSQDILEQVSILYKQKKYNIVESLAKKYLEQKGADNGVRIILAKTLYDRGRVVEAIEQAKLVLKYQPKNNAMKIFMANCYLATQNSTRAITIFKEILDDDSNNVIAIKELAQVYLDTNQKISAIKMFKKLDEFLYSNQEKARNKALVAKLHIEFKEFDSAIEEYKNILEIYPADIEIKKKLVDLYRVTSNSTLLIDLVEEMFMNHTSEEDDLWAIQTLVDAYMRIREYFKALEYANMLKEHPLSNKVQANDKIAKILMETGHVDDSIEILTKLANEEPQNMEIKKSLAAAYESKKDYESVTRVYKKILDEAGIEDIKHIHFEMSNVYANWAMYLFNEGNNDECFKHFTTALQYDLENHQVYYKLGLVNQIIKNFHQAISQYKKAIELDDKNPSYYYAIAEAYKEVENNYEEKKALLECLKYNPNNTKAYYRLALLYEAQHDLINAIPTIKKAIALDENYVAAKYRLALMLESKGDKEGALELYKDIVKIDPEHEGALNNLKMFKA